MKIASVPYINALPLTAYYNFDVVYQPPSALLSLLKNSEVKAALVPTYATINSNLHRYPECGLIGCDGEVKSVGFVSKKELNQIETLYLDTESTTSIQMAKIILWKLFQKDPREIKFFTKEQKAYADAQLLIGDKCLFFNDPGYEYHDLGILWKEMTGLGFVFATWTSLDALNEEEKSALIQAKATGQKEINTLALENCADHSEMIADYLKNNIVYEWTKPLEQGLEAFEKLVSDHANLLATSS